MLKSGTDSCEAKPRTAREALTATGEPPSAKKLAGRQETGLPEVMNHGGVTAKESECVLPVFCGF